MKLAVTGASRPRLERTSPTFTYTPTKRIAAEGAPKLTRSTITGYLSDVSTKTHSTIASDLQGLGLKMKGQSPDGRFMSFVDKSGRLRAQLHPADKVTTTPHLHIYDARGNPLDANLKKAPRTSPDVHIPTGGY